MKNLTLVFSLFLAFNVSAQYSFRAYNLNVKRGQEEAVVKAFTEFSEGEKWKSGGVMLQSVGFKNDVTHRILVWGDPENWGTERERTDEEWDLYREKMNNYTHPNPIDNAMGSLLGFSEGDWKANRLARIYDVRVHDPVKFKSAWDKNVKEAKKILGDRRMGLIRYEVGGTPGATHGLVIYGKNNNDVQVTLRKIQETKAFKEYISSRGKVEYIQTYTAYTAVRFQ
jgi:hypothetical protein|tara:strand:+ start:137 stop:814 length:678 start_codon:yes stop_codon:yes gene_type:complete